MSNSNAILTIGDDSIMAISAIKNNLIQLIDEYENGIEDCFIRGYTKGSIETYGEMLCVTREKNDEAFHDYCMRLKNYLEHDLKRRTLTFLVAIIKILVRISRITASGFALIVVKMMSKIS